MTNKTLSNVLKSTKLSECNYLRNGLYYIKTEVKQMIFDPKIQNEKPHFSIGEFIIITEVGT